VSRRDRGEVLWSQDAGSCGVCVLASHPFGGTVSVDHGPSGAHCGPEREEPVGGCRAHPRGSGEEPGRLILRARAGTDRTGQSQSGAKRHSRNGQPFLFPPLPGVWAPGCAGRHHSQFRAAGAVPAPIVRPRPMPAVARRFGETDIAYALTGIPGPGLPGISGATGRPSCASALQSACELLVPMGSPFSVSSTRTHDGSVQRHYQAESAGAGGVCGASIRWREWRRLPAGRPLAAHPDCSRAAPGGAPMGRSRNCGCRKERDGNRQTVYPGACRKWQALRHPQRCPPGGRPAVW